MRIQAPRRFVCAAFVSMASLITPSGAVQETGASPLWHFQAGG